MNVTLLNTINLDDGSFIKKRGGTKLNNQEKTIDIRENGTTTVVPDSGFTGLSKVSVNTQIGKGLLSDAIRFIDYNGAILYTYSPEEIEEMSELPPLPQHDGLLCQGWNYTLEEIKEQPLFCEVGATYTTDDGATRIKAEFTESDNELALCVPFSNGDVFIDWGDGSEVEKLTSYYVKHEFLPGNYTISIHPEDSAQIQIGYAPYNDPVRQFIGSSARSATYRRTVCNYTVRAIYLGRNITAINGLGVCDNLEEIILPCYKVSKAPSDIERGKLTGLVYPGHNRNISYFASHYGQPFRVSVAPPFNKNNYFPQLAVPDIERCIHPYSKSISPSISYSHRGGYVTDVDYGCPNLSNSVPFTPKNDVMPKIAVLYDRTYNTPSTVENLILVENNGKLSASVQIPYAKNVWILKNKKLQSLGTSSLTIGPSIPYKLSRLPINEITFADSVTTITSSMSESPYLRSVIVGDGPTTIEYSAFRNCNVLSTVVFNNTKITELPNNCFQGCSLLKTVILPTSLVKIAANCFSGCYSLTSIELPAGLTTIASAAFYNCDSLTSITIPDGVTTIEASAFNSCYSLKAFYGKFASSDNRCLIVDGAITAVALAGLSSYSTPSEVTSISNRAFYSHLNLEELIINEGVTTIGNSAFSYSMIKKIKMPSTVMSIGSSAFSDQTYDCIYDFSSHTTIPLIESSSFSTSNTFKVIVPDLLYDEWRTSTNWGKFASSIIKKSDWDAQHA